MYYFCPGWQRRGLVNERGGIFDGNPEGNGQVVSSFVSGLLKPHAAVGQVVRRVNKVSIGCCISCSWRCTAEFGKQELVEETEIPGVHADLTAKASLHRALRFLH